jgi:N6-L-threonylcarbamoyladenine synthase
MSSSSGSSTGSPRASGPGEPTVRVLGIETSCDETAVAVVEDGLTVLSNVLASQHDIHGRFGGVVPELASRAHVERLNPLIDEALGKAETRWEQVDGVAVTRGPGLVGALLVGLATAKAIALARGIPFVAVNHLEGHIYANFLEHGPPQPPYVVLVVSGGHTMLVYMPELRRYEVLGQTLDDAAGEAFDKIARFLGLGYPGGPILDRLARKGNPDAVRFPRAMASSGDYDFSLSGLKTAVIRHVRGEREAGRDVPIEDLAASFQEAVVDVQVQKTMAAAEATGVRTVLLGGGVVANSRLRDRMSEEAEARRVRVLFPSPELCTDNAAMIASAGHFRLEAGERSSYDVSAEPGLPLG